MFRQDLRMLVPSIKYDPPGRVSRLTTSHRRQRVAGRGFRTATASLRPNSAHNRCSFTSRRQNWAGSRLGGQTRPQGLRVPAIFPLSRFQSLSSWDQSFFFRSCGPLSPHGHLVPDGQTSLSGQLSPLRQADAPGQFSDCGLAFPSGQAAALEQFCVDGHPAPIEHLLLGHALAGGQRLQAWASPSRAVAAAWFDAPPQHARPH